MELACQTFVQIIKNTAITKPLESHAPFLKIGHLKTIYKTNIKHRYIKFLFLQILTLSALGFLGGALVWGGGGGGGRSAASIYEVYCCLTTLKLNLEDQ